MVPVDCLKMHKFPVFICSGQLLSLDQGLKKTWSSLTNRSISRQRSRVHFTIFHRYARNLYETNRTFILHCYLFGHHIRKVVSVFEIYVDVVVHEPYLTLRFRVRKKEV